MRLRSNNLKGVLLATAMIAGSASIAMADNTDTNGWQGNDTNGWYYYEEGQKATGWKFINNVWYYFDKTGLMAQDELVYISGETYYLNPTGAMATGWKQVDAKWYFLNEKDGNMETGWKYYNNQWYYLNPGSGEMATNRWINNWYVDSNGVWTQTR